MKGRVLVINGPNLNLLGQRETDIYGTLTLEEINHHLQTVALENNVEIEFFQSNHEGEIVDKIHAARGVNYLLINAGAFTHYSLAIYDALKSVQIPFIELHMSNIDAREPFRQKSVLSPIATGKICGFGKLSYTLALMAACEMLKENDEVK